eukprot:s2882_g5.t1
MSLSAPVEEEDFQLGGLVTVAEDLEPYVLQWPATDEADGVSEALALVVARRSGGFLLALPMGATLERANAGHDAGPVGASTTLVVPGALVDGGMVSPTGTDLEVLVVDLAEELEELEEIAIPFDLDSPFSYPAPAPLLDLSMQWVRGSEPDSGLAFYSATEDAPPGQPPQVPLPKQSRRPRKQPEADDTPTGRGGNPKQKKPTTASLAASMDQLLSLVPNLTSQVQTLVQRQDALESRMTAPTRAGTLGLSQPLSSVMGPPAVSAQAVAKMVASPPPRTKANAGLSREMDFQPPELMALEKEKSEDMMAGGGDLARAVYAQSQALTALVGQIAQSSQDPMVDLGGGTATASTRGALGRAKLQAELATHSGAFYQAVLRSMARRMQPTASAMGTPSELLSRGVSGTLYMERYGGFGKHRDLGLVLYQIMTVMDFLQADNIGAAKDAVALLAVCLDQAVLDGGRFDLAALLTLQEDPPSSIFVNRHQSSLSRSKAFSQLADQKWVTVALAFIKELEVISSKRLELWVLQSRTDFAWHLRRSFFVSVRQRTQLCTTVFPLPLPESSSWCWGSYAGLSKRRLSKLVRARLLHVLVFALDFMYLGRYPTVEELARRPFAPQCDVFTRLRSLVAVCGSSGEPFPLAPGRSGPELGAALMQLEKLVSNDPVFQGGYMNGPVGFREDPALFPRDDFPQLSPYRMLDASRLRLVGCGNWPMEKFICGPLWLPFQEPAILRHGLDVDFSAAPNFKKESHDECLRLVKLWDSKGLARLFEEPVEEGMFCRVFNAFKNSECDRQIGDRRLVNMSELSYDGPSRHLPPGPTLCQLRLDRHREKFCASVTDRRDFYHQAAVTPERAQTNLLPFEFQPAELEKLDAWGCFHAERAARRSSDRVVVGDKLGLLNDRPRLKRWSPKPLFAGFSSLFQGDHLGVEFALCAHQKLLEDAGLLDPRHQVKGHCPFPVGPVYSGLVIDDFFLIGRESIGTEAHDSAAYKALAEARRVYDAEGLLGSKEKDVEASDVFKAAGAEVVSDSHAVQCGFVTVGAPRAKRLALAALSLRTAKLPGLSPQLASRLAGNWSSVLLYRRCLSSVVDGLFALGSTCLESAEGQIVPLPRKFARELVLLSVLSPLICTNAAVEYLGSLFASDASLARGAVVRTEVDTYEAERLWLDSDKKGAYSLLDNGFKEMLKHVGEYEGEEQDPLPLVRPKASPLLYFDFVEICGGVGAVTSAANELGLSCAPPLDLSASRHYDVGDLRLLEWVIYMIEENRFRSFLLEPPCTTFSPAAHPCLRSYALPYGFDRSHPRVVHGNCLAFRSLLLLRVGHRHRRPCGLEQPRRSKMAWLREWISLVSLDDFEEAIVAACMFGSPHQKEFRFLLHLVSAAALETRCTRDHQHVRIQGKYTKKSAIYTPELGMHLALAFRAALRRVVLAEDPEFSCDGLESVVVNDLMCCSNWKLQNSWEWKRPSHINALEVSAGVSVLKTAGQEKPHSRVICCVDSSVARGALTKGRSTSVLLQPLLRRSAVWQVCFDLYPVWPFCPTRHNVADDPTRSVNLRKSCPLSIRGRRDVDYRLLHRCGLRRFAANWVRLFLLVSYLQPADGLSCESSVDFELAECIFPALSAMIALVLGVCWSVCLLGAVVTVFRIWWISLRRHCHHGRWVVWFVFVCSARALAPLSPRFDGFQLGALAMEPGSAAERQRAAARGSTVLTGDRVILEATRQRRKRYLKQFQVWLWGTKGISLSFLLQQKPPDPEKICDWLVAYGRELFKAGKAYGIFAETINAVSAARPHLRKQMTLAWDFAYSWVADEPFSHRPAMPASVLLAVLSVAILWGWIETAAILGLTWAGVLRIGEALQAVRSDLVLPEDAAPGMTHALLRIREPKTRGRHARHQAARVDPVDIVQLLRIAFSQKNRFTTWVYFTSRVKALGKDAAFREALDQAHAGGDFTYQAKCDVDPATEALDAKAERRAARAERQKLRQQKKARTIRWGFPGDLMV